MRQADPLLRPLQPPLLTLAILARDACVVDERCVQQGQARARHSGWAEASRGLSRGGCRHTLLERNQKKDLQGARCGEEAHVQVHTNNVSQV